MMKETKLWKRIEEKLSFLFEDYSQRVEILEGLQQLVQRYDGTTFAKREEMNERRAYLITYGDSLYNDVKEETSLKTLSCFLKKEVSDVISDVHLLPMFEYTSDDGFSVVDYMRIHPKLGSWEDISDLNESFHLMFDFVANHLSKQSTWFKKFLNQEEGFENSFVREDENFDASNVMRPRTSPLFHTYDSVNGPMKVWTTFSEDQVDINFKDPKTFVRICEVLLEYCAKGASSIRLDAIGFIWKESKTSCLSLPQTHKVIEIHRELVDYFCANTQIITETNVPHEENISYFGSGDNEAHQVYQFALPPLVLHTFTCNNSERLTAWAKNIQAPSSQATFFNFLASHDGIGMRPVETILSAEEKQLLMDKVVENGGKISYKTNADGSQSAYELNINYSEALRNKGENDEIACKKMLAAHHILLSLVGVPAIYYHSILGSKNDLEGVAASGIARRINREKLEVNKLCRQLEEDTYRKTIFEGIKEMLSIRKYEKAFNPYGKQEVLQIAPSIMAIKRVYENEVIYCYTNVSDKEVKLPFISGINLLTQKKEEGSYLLMPYEYIWIKDVIHG